MKYIYLIHNLSNNYLKIGYSKNPNQRLNQLNIHGDCTLLAIIGPYKNSKKEKELHNKFSRYKEYKEWFKYNQAIVQEFTSSNKYISNIQERINNTTGVTHTLLYHSNSSYYKRITKLLFNMPKLP